VEEVWERLLEVAHGNRPRPTVPRLVREAYASKRLTYRRSREKNLATLAALGWLPSQMFAFVADLEPEQALCVPRRNTNPAHPEEMVCEFGADIEGESIYIKITVVGIDDGAAGCVVSFHFAEKPLVFPFRR
jgi:hypothetical protein